MANGKADKPCLVIGPIGPEGTEEWKKALDVVEYIIRPAAKEAGYQAMRVDELPGPGTITPEIVGRLLTDEIIIADLTGWNASVFYELAIRHCSPNRAVILLIEKGQKIPFDVAPEAGIFYDWSDSGSPARCQKQMVEQIRFAEENPDKSESPVSATLDAMVNREAENLVEQQIVQLKFAVQELRSEVTYLRNRSSSANEPIQIYDTDQQLVR